MHSERPDHTRLAASRQEDAARELEEAVADLKAEIEACPEAAWHGVVPNGWTRAAIAMHCAMGNDVGTAWIAFLISGRDILDTSDFHNEMNGRVAERTRLTTKQEALEALARSSDRATHYLRSLTEDELERHAHFGIAERETTAGRFLPGLGRHVREHTEQFRDGL